MKRTEIRTDGQARGVWEYRPGSHKTQHHGKGRVIPIGPKAQAILSPRMEIAQAPDFYLFPPYGKPRKMFSVRNLDSRIRKRCLAAGVPVFSPNQLRHNALTEIRREHGIEIARAVAGHSDISVTGIYAEAEDLEKATKAAQGR